MHHIDFSYMLKLLVLTFVIITTLTVNPYLTLQVESSPESSSLSSDDNGDDGDENNGSEEMNKGDLINKLTEEQDLAGENGEEPTDGGTVAPPNGVESTEADEKKKCVTNKEGVKFCFERLPHDELPCPEPIVVDDPPLNPDVLCVPPKEGIDTSNITTPAISELMNQTEPIDNVNTTEGDFVITEEGKPSELCLVINEEGTPSSPGRPQPPQPSPQPSPSPKPC